MKKLRFPFILFHFVCLFHVVQSNFIAYCSIFINSPWLQFSYIYAKIAVTILIKKVFLLFHLICYIIFRVSMRQYVQSKLTYFFFRCENRYCWFEPLKFSLRNNLPWIGWAKSNTTLWWDGNNDNDVGNFSRHRKFYEKWILFICTFSWDSTCENKGAKEKVENVLCKISRGKYFELLFSTIAIGDIVSLTIKRWKERERKNLFVCINVNVIDDK